MEGLRRSSKYFSQGRKKARKKENDFRVVKLA
jgi:hypothetical protein